MATNKLPSSVMAQGQRIEFIDLAKGICITLVVLYHVFGDLSGDIINMMTLFRMPLYFVLSGLFFKQYSGLWSFFKKKANKLLIPFLLCYLFFNIPTTIWIELKEGVDTSILGILWEDGFRPNLGINKPIWFLLCLFIVNIIFYIICMVSKNIMVRIFLSFACGITGWYLGITHTSLYLWIDTALTATPFFVMGYMMRNYGNILHKKISAIDYVLSGLCLVLLVGIYYFNKTHNEILVNYIYNEYDVDVITVYLGGFVGTYLVLMFSKAVNNVPILSYIGKYSIVVLITHQAYRFFIRNILYQFGVPQESTFLNLSVFIFLMIIEIPTIKYGIKYLPVCFAQKDIWK